MCVKEELLFVKLGFSKIESLLCQVERKVTLLDVPSLAEKNKLLHLCVVLCGLGNALLLFFFFCEKKSWKSVVVQACKSRCRLQSCRLL